LRLGGKLSDTGEFNAKELPLVGEYSAICGAVWMALIVFVKLGMPGLLNP